MKISLFKRQSPDEKFKETLGKYKRAADENPNDIRVHVKIAELYLEHDKKDEAIEEYILAARAYQEKRLFQIAVAIYNHAISIDPDRVEVYTELANLHLRNGFVGDGVSVLEKLADHYYQKDMAYEAAQVLKKIKEIDPNNEFFKIKVAKFYKTKEISEEETLRAGPRDKWSLVEQQSGKPENIAVEGEGFFDLEMALTDDDDMAFEFGETDGMGTGTVGDMAPDEVFKQLKTIMESQPDQDSPDFHYNLGQAYQRCNQLEEAVHEYTTALEGVQHKGECCKRLVECYALLKQFDRAQHMIETGLKLEGLSERDKMDLVYQSGLIYKATGDLKKAFKIFKKIYSIDQNFRSVAMEVKQLSTR